MKRYINYIKYVFRHKYFVWIAGRRIGVSPIRLLFHNMSKFSFGEFASYAKCFYNEDGSNQYDESEQFLIAWNDHQKKNKHHWQYWGLALDDGSQLNLTIPQEYIDEMVADWLGAGKAITGKWDLKYWYDKNRLNIELNDISREKIEILIERCDRDVFFKN